MASKIQLRRDTASNWSSNSTIILSSGEPGFETDTGKFKIGNGIDDWGSLDYAGAGVTTNGSVYIGNGAGGDGNACCSIGIGDCAGGCSQGCCAIAIGDQAGEFCQGSNAIAIGDCAGQCCQGSCAIAIGSCAAECCQGSRAIAIGSCAGRCRQGSNAIAIGSCAGHGCCCCASNQSDYAIAIGNDAGYYDQGIYAIAIGKNAGYCDQGACAIAIGHCAGNCCQGFGAVAVGDIAGNCGQGDHAVAVGYATGNDNQGHGAVGIGVSAGRNSQGEYGIAIGYRTARCSQQTNAIAIGTWAAESDIFYTVEHDGTYIGTNDGSDSTITLTSGFDFSSVRSGMVLTNNGYTDMLILSISGNTLTLAGTPNNGSVISGATFNVDGRQGANAIAIGAYAARYSQSPNSIVINSTGSELPSAGTGTTVIQSLRQVSGGTAPSGFTSVYWNPTTGELITVTA